MFKTISFKLAGGFGQLIVSFLRALIVGGLTVVFLIFNIDNFTDSAYGVNNLVIITSSFAFFPVFFVLVVEFFFADLRKKQKKNTLLEKQIKASDL